MAQRGRHGSLLRERGDPAGRPGAAAAPGRGRHLGRERPDNLVPAGIRHRTEHLPVLADKLEGYQVVAAGLAWHGQVCPVLLFSSAPRAANRPPAAR